MVLLIHLLGQGFDDDDEAFILCCFYHIRLRRNQTKLCLLMWHAFNRSFLGMVAAFVHFGWGLTEMLGNRCLGTKQMLY